MLVRLSAVSASLALCICSSSSALIASLPALLQADRGAFLLGLIVLHRVQSHLRQLPVRPSMRVNLELTGGGSACFCTVVFIAWSRSLTRHISGAGEGAGEAGAE